MFVINNNLSLPRVPLPRGQDGDRVEELVDAGEEVLALLGLVGHVVEDLVRHDGGHGASDLVVAAHVRGVVALFRENITCNDILIM